MSDRRDHILRIAERLFRHYGVDKTTMSDIAGEVGVAVGTIYLEFSSKEAIVGEVASCRHRSILEAMGRAFEGEGSFAERLRQMMLARTRQFIELADHGAHGDELVHCEREAVREAWRCFEREQQALIADLLRRAADAGEFAATDPDRTAQAILEAHACLSPPRLFGFPRPRVADLGDQIFELIFLGLKTR